MKQFIPLLLSSALLWLIIGCNNTSEKGFENTSGETDTTNMAEIVDAQAVIEEVQPFKGVWIYKDEGDYDKENGLSFGRYEVRLVLNFYEKNVYDGLEWSNGGFSLANDRKEGDCQIISFKINGNEADIKYESISTATFSAKLIYDPKDHSMTLIDGELIKANDVPENIINEFRILRNKTKLAFETKNVINQNVTNLTGSLSNSKIRMALYKNQYGEKEVNGNYCYTKHNKVLHLSGKTENEVYTLNEMDNGNITATFTLKRKAGGSWEGIWTNGIETFPVTLQEVNEL